VVIALGALLLVRALTADDDSGGGRDATTTSAATDATATTLATGDPELQGLLLRLDELPDGWTQGAQTGAAEELCEGRDPVSEVPPTSLSQTGFTHGGQSPVLSNVVADYDTDARAAELLAAVRTAIAECGRYEAEGGSYEITEVEGPDLGDEVVAADITGQTALGALEGRLLYVRVGDRVSALALVGFDDVDTDLVAEAAATVADRL
jgi:hypothetical protein